MFNRLMDVVKTEFVVLDERFARCNGDEWMRRLHTGCRWTEGPVYFPAGRYLLFSDIPNERIMRWDETTDQVGVFRQPSNYANGHTRDRAGRLVSCEQGTRRVTRTEHDGTVTVLAERHRGRRLNSPNDVIERSDGSIWFTDPSYGIDSDYEGYRADSEIGGCHVYRVDPADGEVRIVADDFERPNGLAFSVDESRLYIADTRQKPSHIRVFDVTDDGTLTGGEAHDGLHCFAPDGTLIGKLRVPEICSNLTFGGPRRNELFITASSSLYSLRVNVNGAR
jgi:gluconolactonase